MSITFSQVTQIESIRRRIEELQDNLKRLEAVTQFGYQSPDNKWRGLSGGLIAPMRAVACKITATEILGLLAEAEKEGVDVTESKMALVEFLDGLKKI
jgi:hypothetical protein